MTWLLRLFGWRPRDPEPVSGDWRVHFARLRQLEEENDWR